jgi:hypothetical protein
MTSTSNGSSLTASDGTYKSGPNDALMQGTHTPAHPPLPQEISGAAMVGAAVSVASSHAPHAPHSLNDLKHKVFATSVPGTEIKKQISYIAPGQTAKALMLIYLTFSVPLVILALVIGFIGDRGPVQMGAVFGALILNAVIGFVLMWIACHAYNWIASRFGGIEIVLSDTPEEV